MLIWSSICNDNEHWIKTICDIYSVNVRWIKTICEINSVSAFLENLQFIGSCVLISFNPFVVS